MPICGMAKKQGNVHEKEAKGTENNPDGFTMGPLLRASGSAWYLPIRLAGPTVGFYSYMGPYE
jgi:hypothetical protein